MEITMKIIYNERQSNYFDDVVSKMKKIITLLLLLFTIQLSAQKKDAWKVITVYTSSIGLDAIGDGLNDSGNKTWGHVCNATSIGVLLTSPFIIDYDKSKWGYYLTSYTALRIAFFDYTYNATRGLPLNTVGSTSFWDKGINKLNPPDTYFPRTCFLILGISIPLNELNR